MKGWFRKRKILDTSFMLCHLTITVSMVFLWVSVSCANDVAWKQADRPRVWMLPRDHGAHLDYRTEWWYFTGNLSDGAGNIYGYQLTFFREGVIRRPKDPGNPWSLRDLFFAHFTITDVAGKRFIVEEQISRAGPGLAGSSTKDMNVWLLNWSIQEKGGMIHLLAKNRSTELDLQLSPAKPVVLHGTNGLSRKGEKVGQASYYESVTELRTVGTLKLPASSTLQSVHGVSWFDHEFGSNQLTQDQIGWDWFSLHLSDGRDLMLYLLRRSDGTIESTSSGTSVSKTGASRHITLRNIGVDVAGHWKSPKSNATYPSKWRLRIPSEGIDVTISPLLPDQELRTPGSTGVTYWEGAVHGDGTSRGRIVSVEGYVELTGYSGKLGGLF
jgi:predicted secreted hydrolase